MYEKYWKFLLKKLNLPEDTKETTVYPNEKCSIVLDKKSGTIDVSIKDNKSVKFFSYDLNEFRNEECIQNVADEIRRNIGIQNIVSEIRDDITKYMGDPRLWKHILNTTDEEFINLLKNEDVFLDLLRYNYISDNAFAKILSLVAKKISNVDYEIGDLHIIYNSLHNDIDLIRYKKCLLFGCCGNFVSGKRVYVTQNQQNAYLNLHECNYVETFFTNNYIDIYGTAFVNCLYDSRITIHNNCMCRMQSNGYVEARNYSTVVVDSHSASVETYENARAVVHNADSACAYGESTIIIDGNASIVYDYTDNENGVTIEKGSVVEITNVER